MIFCAPSAVYRKGENLSPAIMVWARQKVTARTRSDVGLMLMREILTVRALAMKPKARLRSPPDWFCHDQVAESSFEGWTAFDHPSMRQSGHEKRIRTAEPGRCSRSKPSAQ